jgi:hypothetical protein
MQLLDRDGEAVAHALELSEVEQHRPAARDAGHTGGRGDVRKALGDDRGTLALESRDLSPQRRPCGTLTALVSHQASIALERFAGATVAWGIEQSLTGAFSIALLLLVVGHTRLLSGRAPFYQRTRAR